MKVILLVDIKGVGRKNDLVSIADGYALNFIVPKKLGIRATPAETIRHNALVKKEIAELERLKNVAAQLANESLVMTLKTGAQGEVFNSITTNDITRALEARGYTHIKEVDIPKPIRVIGEHPATVRFGHGIEAKITIIVTVDK